MVRASEPDRFIRRTSRALARQRRFCADPVPVAEAVLGDLLGQATGTSFGDEHGLGPARTLADFKAAVPIRDYESIRPYIERQLTGESRVLTRSEPYAFLKTSGTSGRPKLVPTTRHWRNRYRGPALYAQWGLYFQRLGLTSLYEGAVLDLSWERSPAPAGSGRFPVYSVTGRPASVGERDWTPPWYDVPWFTGGDDSDAATGLYRKLRLLVDRDVRLIVAVNPSKITALAAELSASAERLVREVREGTLLGAPHPLLRPDPALAWRLDALRDFGGGDLLLPDLWPNLSLLVCWRSASARFYQGWLERIAPDVPVIPFSTTGTEGIVTLPVDTHPSAGPLAVGQGVYEFVPCPESDDGSPLTPDEETLSFAELSTGGTYRLVMSQANGLYRYDVGDVYRVAGWVGELPRLEFAGRGGSVSSFTGEKLTEQDFFAAVHRALPAGDGMSPPVFSAVPVWDTPPYYVLTVEWPRPLQAMGTAEFARRAEAALCDVNSEYEDKRRTGRLRPLRVRALSPGTFRNLAERRSRQGIASAQVKHYWLQRDGRLLRELDELSPTGRPAAVAGSSA
ncbi:GH3 auxin-responsive promoter family protein [Streptomyces malaysiensis subsp. malaysiensis]|uniref:GH3 auxin-responsive promoter family protein n=1 Tax=Streptomyces malaysiensis TaxID=92644 RepID=A0ABX6WIF6_STRMQ|nr:MULTISPECIES: GH3 auxin-responsive promoter family protein [Streptomyces]QPI61232.1 GH3 auxin-responsive promoter family protein [Streptomyces solisilvae]UHH22994.1 GH3 auxin-responsive promoter family protein [Streptomyces sp. HNM0561]